MFIHPLMGKKESLKYLHLMVLQLQRIKGMQLSQNIQIIRKLHGLVYEMTPFKLERESVVSFLIFLLMYNVELH